MGWERNGKFNPPLSPFKANDPGTFEDREIGGRRRGREEGVKFRGIWQNSLPEKLILLFSYKPVVTYSIYCPANCDYGTQRYPNLPARETPRDQAFRWV